MRSETGASAAGSAVGRVRSLLRAHALPLGGLEAVFAQQVDGLPSSGTKVHLHAGREMTLHICKATLWPLPDRIRAGQPVRLGLGVQMAAPPVITASPFPSSRLPFGTEPTTFTDVLRGCGS